MQEIYLEEKASGPIAGAGEKGDNLQDTDPKTAPRNQAASLLELGLSHESRNSSTYNGTNEGTKTSSREEWSCAARINAFCSVTLTFRMAFFFPNLRIVWVLSRWENKRISEFVLILVSIITVYIKNTCQTTFAFVIFLLSYDACRLRNIRKNLVLLEIQVDRMNGKGCFIASQILNILHDSLEYSHIKTPIRPVFHFEIAAVGGKIRFFILCTNMSHFGDQSILRSIPFYRYHRTHRLYQKTLVFTDGAASLHLWPDKDFIQNLKKKNWARSRRSIFSSQALSSQMQGMGLFRWAPLHNKGSHETETRSSSCHPTCSQNL